MKISFNNPNVFKFPKKIILQKFSSNGIFTNKCSNWLKKEIKCKDAILTHSCTAALEMCALLLDIRDGDEIIMPSFTFVSTASAFVLRGGKPVFVDIDPNTCNIDPLKIKQAISKKTKAIVVVHYAGVSCDMDPIVAIAKKHKLYIIEDAAQAILSSYKKKPLGSIGDLATLSFHETKNIHCGEGGALIINNSKFINRAKIIRDKGTDRDLFDQNMIKKYTWVDYGSSYGLSEINAAFLLTQLQIAKDITKKRVEIFNYYHNLLETLEIKGFIQRPNIPNYTKINGHIYFIIIKKKKRNNLIKFLKQKKISALFHYIPLHNSPFGKLKTTYISKMKNTEYISKNCIRIPMHTKIKKKHVKFIVKNIYDFFKKNPK